MVVSEEVTVEVEGKDVFVKKELTDDIGGVSVRVLNGIPLRYLKEWRRESPTSNSVLIVELPGPRAVDVLEHWAANIETSELPSPPLIDLE